MPFWKSKKQTVGKVNTPAILVLAVKGGTGKTMVSRELILNLAEEMKIGALDADVDSPNLAECLGVRAFMQLTGERRFVPVERDGIKMFSTSLYHPSASKGWTKTGQQNQIILRDAALNTDWGEVDLFVIDMPAGSSDEFKAVKDWFSNIRGVVVVTQPNTLSDLARAFDITSRFMLPILGVVENMVEVECQKCGHQNVLWDAHGSVQKMCEEAGVRYLGHIGWIRKLQRAAENGRGAIPERYSEVITQLIEVIRNG